ncbi:unnamed protein product [Schistocephalus solidus]|uniref:Transmembrane protein n=1 Tax=Schistocephalus solidus TaxID=70667 RepID=A0A183T357_SCHSO|nr:unnamed protein product [Schistocephalus solidus]
MSYVSLEGGSLPFPPDVQTPVSDQLDDVTYPGSEVTVINRTPDQPAHYWPKSGCFVPSTSGYHSIHQGNSHNFTVAPSGRSYPFENESSSTLSCADGYQVQNQEEALGGSASFTCPSGHHATDAETLRDGAATMCDCNSDILLGAEGSVTSLDKNLPSSPTSFRKQQQHHHHHHHHQRKKHTSGRSSRSKKRRTGGGGQEEEEEECSFFRRGGRRSHKASSGVLSHCLSEDDSLTRRQRRSTWGTRRSDYLRRSGKSRSPADRSNQCSDCVAATACGTNRSWNSMAPRHANSLPTLKKRQQNSPPCGFSQPPLRNRKPANGLFGFNLAASRAEEQWSDTEQASATAHNGQMYKTVESGCSGLICLSFICIVGISCLFSPIGMLLLPFMLSFTSQSLQSPVDEDFVSSTSALSLDDPSFLESRSKSDVLGITCNTRCEADLLSLCVKLIILCLTTWKLYVLPVVLVYRRLGIRLLSVSAILNRKLRAGCYKANSQPVNPSSLHPCPIERPFAVTISVNFLSFGATCAFWVVFVARWMNSSGSSQRPVRISNPTDLFGLDDLSSSRSTQTASLLAYSNLVSFVLTFADTQLVLHILGLILGGLQRLLTDKTIYVVQVVRSPDGHSKSYCVNGGSIDCVATELLYRYLVDFPVSN